jgi:UDP-glucose:(heptosyl)LPS alpha-1,3-glucosyltransferase
MNILLVIFNADPTHGGAERYTADLAAGLLSRGHQVAIASAMPDPNPPSNLRQIPLNAAGLTRSSQYRTFLNSVDRLIETEKFDRVHAMIPIRKCDIYHPHAGVEWEWLATGIRWIKRVSNPRRYLIASTESQLIKSGAHVICLSDYSRQQLLSYYSVPDERLSLAYNGVNLNHFSPGQSSLEIREKHQIPSDAPVGLMVANNLRLRSLLETLAAIASMKDKTLHLIVAGKEKTDKYESFARVLKIEDRVHFAGKSNNVVELYRSADFFIHPSKHDTCGLVVLEALATGLPVLITRQTGASSLVGKAGIVIDSPQNLPQLQSALDQLCNPSTRKTMHEESLKIRPSLSQEHHIDRILEIYNLK